ncbi:MAG TPA: cytochrome c oxidase subunit II [Alphaproteobacteria bacterium]|nr:cytochrome c oxidase subunit II [Alphaproteobacteria bacterium]
MPVILALLMGASALLIDGPVLAQEPVRGAPTAWQLNFQPAASPVMDMIESLHDLLLFIIVAISAFVLVLLAYVCVRYRASRQAVPSRRTHNSVLEIAWTAIPVLILVVIAIPSFKLLYFMDRAVNPEMTLKAIGHQWYWSYEYPDDGNFTFDAYMIADQDLQPGQPRLLAVDNPVVLPVDTDVRVLTTATDVIHSWAVPALGVKMDAIPGRLNETWLRIEQPGIYYGQCSELCGDYHGFMPIEIEALSKEDYKAWTKKAQEQFARADEGVAVAARQASE